MFKKTRDHASSPAFAAALIARADAARDAARFRDAATLYVEALLIRPGDAGIHVQAGHMFKEAGDLRQAERHYAAAARLKPNDADLALQLGHFHKLAGRLNDAAAAYDRAAALAPDWPQPAVELAGLRQSGWRAPGDAEARDADPGESDPLGLRRSPDSLDLTLANAFGRLAPANLPRPLEDLLHHSHDSIVLRQFGVRLDTFWGQRPVLRGIEAVRGFCISTTPILRVDARVNGLPIHRGSLKGPYQLEYEPDKRETHKYVFNIWCDVSQFVPGLYELELEFVDARQDSRYLREQFVVEPALSEAEHPRSDAAISLPVDGVGTLEDQISARPSAVHPAKRPNMLPDALSILVTRPDQLGDLVASIPAIKRLRELFPEARLVGLFGPANVDLARTLKLFDDIVVVDFRESMSQRTRTLSLADQEELRERLAAYKFDVAIDLSQSLMSRPLLALSGAAFTYGFKDPNWPRLTSSVDDAYLDAKNHREIASHSTRILSMINRLGTLKSSSAEIIRRHDLTRDGLQAYGIGATDRFAVLHTGARIEFSRWPYYADLAGMILDKTDLKIVLFTDNPALHESLPTHLAGSDRLMIIDRQLPFDDFDALLSFCTVYVGNDSGPKHLASLRGVPVISIHSARINWSEWGQEHTGVIITRKVPCAGCLLYHDVDECGKDYVCITDIKLHEVFDAVMRYV